MFEEAGAREAGIGVGQVGKSLPVALIVLAWGAGLIVPLTIRAEDAPVLLVFPPWISAEEAVARTAASDVFILGQPRQNAVLVKTKPQSDGARHGSLRERANALFSVNLSISALCAGTASPSTFGSLS